MKTQTIQKQAAKNNVNKKKILVVDDHPITRQGLAKTLNQETDLMIVGEAEDSSQAMEAIRKLRPDMVIVDISLKGSNGLELTKIIRQKYPALPVLIQSMHDETMYSERALQTGAMGYIMKDAPTEDLITAVRKVLSGQIYTSGKMAERLVNKAIHGRVMSGNSPASCLSNRELEVFSLLGTGYGTRQIAEKLNLSAKTVETYRAHIKEKLELADASELRRYAIRWTASHNEQEVRPQENSANSANVGCKQKQRTKTKS